MPNQGTAPYKHLLYRCADCGFMTGQHEFPDAKKLSMRLTPGDTYTDKECPKCEALAFPVDAAPKLCEVCRRPDCEPAAHEVWTEFDPATQLWVEKAEEERS